MDVRLIEFDCTGSQHAHGTVAVNPSHVTALIEIGPHTTGICLLGEQPNQFVVEGSFKRTLAKLVGVPEWAAHQ